MKTKDDQQKEFIEARADLITAILVIAIAVVSCVEVVAQYRIWKKRHHVQQPLTLGD